MMKRVLPAQIVIGSPPQVWPVQTFNASNGFMGSCKVYVDGNTRSVSQILSPVVNPVEHDSEI